MNIKKKFVGLSMLTAAGVLASFSVLGVVRADVAPQPPLPEDGTTADAEATVTMKERCVWYVDGVPSEVVLVATDEMTSDVYDGTQYDLIASLDSDIVAYSDGNLAETPSPDAHTACTLFGEQTGIAITGSWDGSDFTATAVDCGEEDCTDPNMDFSAGGMNPVLALNISEGDCRTPGNNGAGSSEWDIGDEITSTDLSENIISLSAADATPVPLDLAEKNDKCNANLEVETSIPASKTPLFAGKSYNFAGPTFTTDIEIKTDR